jgi:glycosyltransferase involved in cell wall biosynthesis
MKILWVKANKLLPVHSGGDIRSYHLARQLALLHDLWFLSYYDGHPDPSYAREFEQHFPNATCVSTGKSESRAARIWDYARRIGDRAPYAVSRFACADVRHLLGRWFEEQKFDVAICDFLDAAVNFPSKLNIPSVLFQHNVESEIWRRHGATETNSVKRLMYSLEYRKMRRYERTMVGRFQHVIAVSEHDRALMGRWVEPSRITVVPTGVDLHQYRPHFSSRESSTVVFVGAMDWEPNVDAIEYFCREIWPDVLAAVPEARFRIVGRNPDHRIKKLASDSVEVTGRVPSVVDHLRDAAVVVVPLRIGGGTRLKIYEAMAVGKAVVSTSVGAEGLDVHDGKDIILADDPTRFVEAIANLLRNGEIRHRYETAAAELASRQDWSSVGAKFAQVLERVVASKVHPGDQALRTLVVG